MAGRFAWLLAGALIVFGVLGAASIGLPFLLSGVVLFGVLRRRRERVDAGPLLGGAGAVFIALGLLNLGLTLGTALLALGIATFAAGRVACHRQTA